MTRSTLASAALMGMLTVSAMGVAVAAQAEDKMAADKPAKEKCYGVAKAGKNDCAAKDGSNSCAGTAAKDAEKGAWLYVPAGLCDRLVNGSKS